MQLNPSRTDPKDLPGGGRSAPQVDRDAVARVLTERQEDLRRVARMRLSASMTRLYDSADVFSTILRRIDKMSAEGEVAFSSPEAVLALARSMIGHVVIDKHRIVKRIEKAESEDFAYMRGLGAAMSGSASGVDADLDLEHVMDQIDCPKNKLVLWTWLAGMSQNQTADLLGLSVDAVRHRWMRIRAHIADTYKAFPEYS